MSVSIGDVNNDGILDVVSNSITEGRVSFFKGNGDGSFAQRISIARALVGYVVKVADLDSDGNLDLVSTYGTSAQIGVMLGNRKGTFRAERNYRTRGAVNGAAALSIVDMNSDGNLDAVTVNSSDGSISALTGRRDGSFDTGATVTSGCCN